MYGPHWVLPLSTALNVSERTMRYWKDGKFQPPDGVWTDIARLCVERSDALKALAKELKRR